MALTKQDYEDALQSQDAVNSTALIHALSRVVTRIREEPDFSGTEYVNKHPIVILYLEQLCTLSGEVLDHPKYGDAYHACKKGAEQDA